MLRRLTTTVAIALVIVVMGGATPVFAADPPPETTTTEKPDDRNAIQKAADAATAPVRAAADKGKELIEGEPKKEEENKNLIDKGRELLTGAADTATCKKPPEPEDPAVGWGGILGDGPADPSPARSPFKKEKDGKWVRTEVPIQEAYGYAAPLQTYDLGCAGTIQESPWDRVAQGAAMGGPFMLGLRDRLNEGVMHPETVLAPLRSALDTLAPATRDGIWKWMFPLAMGVLVCILIVCAIRSEPSRAFSMFGWAMLMLATTSLFLKSPTASLDLAAKVFNEGVSEINGGKDPSTAAGDQAYERIWWNTWVTTQFGTDEKASPTAAKYAIPLFRSRVLSYAEKKQLREHPEQGKALLETKKKEFTDIAEKVNQEDPMAYRYLTGGTGLFRAQRFVMADVGVFGAVALRIVAGIMAMAALVALALFIGLFPVPAGLAIAGHRLALLHLCERVAGVVLGALALSFAANVVEIFVSAFLGTLGQGPWIIFLLILVTLWAAWHFIIRRREMSPAKIADAVREGVRRGMKQSGDDTAENADAGTRRWRKRKQSAPASGPSETNGATYGERLRERVRSEHEGVVTAAVNRFEAFVAPCSRVPERRRAGESLSFRPMTPRDNTGRPGKSDFARDTAGRTTRPTSSEGTKPRRRDGHDDNRPRTAPSTRPKPAARPAADGES